MQRTKDQDREIAKNLYSEMASKDKRAHFWHYNKKWFFLGVAILCVAIIFVIVSNLGSSEEETILNMKFVNVSMNGMNAKENYITDTLLKDVENSNGKIVITDSKIDVSDATKAGKNMEDIMVEVVSGNIDVMIMDSNCVTKFASSGFEADLSTYMNQNFMDSHKNELLYYTNPDNEVVPMAIKISGTNFVKNAGLEANGDIYFSFIENSERVDMAKNFLELIFSEEEK
jgi:hypothetical protein